MTIHLTGNLSKALSSTKAKQVAQQTAEAVESFSTRDKVWIGIYTACIASNIAAIVEIERNRKLRERQAKSAANYKAVIATPEIMMLNQQQALALSAYAHNMVKDNTTPKLNVMA